jgi:hypothetical protein
MTDSSNKFLPDSLSGLTIYNQTDDSSGEVIDNDETSITVNALTGGSLNTWTADDEYKVISAPYENPYKIEFSETSTGRRNLQIELISNFYYDITVTAMDLEINNPLICNQLRILEGVTFIVRGDCGVIDFITFDTSTDSKIYGDLISGANIGLSEGNLVVTRNLYAQDLSLTGGKKAEIQVYENVIIQNALSSSNGALLCKNLISRNVIAEYGGIFAIDRDVIVAQLFDNEDATWYIDGNAVIGELINGDNSGEGVITIAGDCNIKGYEGEVRDLILNSASQLMINGDLKACHMVYVLDASILTVCGNTEVVSGIEIDTSEDTVFAGDCKTSELLNEGPAVVTIQQNLILPSGGSLHNADVGAISIGSELYCGDILNDSTGGVIVNGVAHIRGVITNDNGGVIFYLGLHTEVPVTVEAIDSEDTNLFQLDDGFYYLEDMYIYVSDDPAPNTITVTLANNPSMGFTFEINHSNYANHLFNLAEMFGIERFQGSMITAFVRASGTSVSYTTDCIYTYRSERHGGLS